MLMDAVEGLGLLARGQGQGDLSALLGDWLGGKRETTLRAYRASMQSLVGFLGCATVEEAAREVLMGTAAGANALALRWKNHLLAEGKSPATINLRLSALRSLVDLAQTLGLVSWSINVRGVKAENVRDCSGPGIQAVSAMVRTQEGSKKGLRDKAILTLLGTLALRRAELVGLDLSDYREGAVWVLGKGKVGKVRMQLPSVAREALEGWLQVRGLEDGPLFRSLARSYASGRMTGQAIYDLVKKAGDGLGMNVRPHGIRHSSITASADLAAAAGMSIDRVRDLSRHSNLQTLTRYLDRGKSSQGQLSEMLGSVL